MIRNILSLALITAATVIPATAGSECKISKSSAQNIALKNVNGSITETELERTKAGSPFWSVEIRNRFGREREVHVDGKTGKILSISFER